MSLKKLLGGCVIAAGLVLTSTMALAEKVYDASSGAWRIQGYTDGVDRSCVISTYWDDGKQINLNVFVDSGNLTVTINNPEWGISEGYAVTTDVWFLYGSGAQVPVTVTLQYKGPTKLIMRNVKPSFLTNFLDARTMVVFSGESDQLNVDLTGTTAVGVALSECDQAVHSF